MLNYSIHDTYYLLIITQYVCKLDGKSVARVHDILQIFLCSECPIFCYGLHFFGTLFFHIFSLYSGKNFYFFFLNMLKIENGKYFYRINFSNICEKYF